MGERISWIQSKINKVYFDQEILNEIDLYKSRKISILEGCTARTIMTLCGGTFLAGLASYLGVNDQVNGIIGAIPTLSTIVMILSPIVLERLYRRKFLITVTVFLSRLLLSFMFLLPLILKDSMLKIVFLISAFLIANFSISFITPAASYWLISLTPESIRGKYFGKRESIVLGVTTISVLAMGRILDFWKNAGYESIGFIFLFAITSILAVLNFIFSSIIQEPKVKIEKTQFVFSELVTKPLKDKVFRKIIIILILWNIGLQFSAPFTAVYMISGLKLDYTYIAIMVGLASAVSIISARTLGKLADRYSWLLLMSICVTLQATSQIVWVLVNNFTYYLLIPLAQILSGSALGGVNISITNIQFKYSPSERKTVYLGFSSAVGGMVGFISSLCGSALLGNSKQYNLLLYGFNDEKMKLVFGISSVLLIICVIKILLVNRKY